MNLCFSQNLPKALSSPWQSFFDGLTDSTNCILFDYFEPYLDYAESMGVKTIKGGLNKLNDANIKPDLIVINHVVEHWNNFEHEIEQLIKASTINKTIIYSGEIKS